MKFAPRIPDNSVNVSSRNYMRQVMWMLGVCSFALVATYGALGLMVNTVVTNMSQETEAWIWSFTVANDSASKHAHSPPAQEKELALQAMLDQAIDHSSIRGKKVRLNYSEDSTVNAMAIPGEIIIFAGLVGRIKSENELMTVLGHEVGHLANRDHLRLLGRKLVLTLLSRAMLGDKNGATAMLARTLQWTEIEFSRKQEIAADSVGLEIAVKIYGHAGGATNIFEIFKEMGGQSRALEFLRSHPHPDVRIENMDRLIKKNHYPIRQTMPLPKALQHKKVSPFPGDFSFHTICRKICT